MSNAIFIRQKRVYCTKCGFLGWRSSDPNDGTTTGTWECARYWRDHIQTEKDLGKGVDYDTGDDIDIFCSRGQWHSITRVRNTKLGFINLDDLVSPRSCPFYLRYEPGFKPEEHKELLRDFQTRQAVFKGSLIGALIGAAAAIVAQVLYIIFTSL